MTFKILSTPTADDGFDGELDLEVQALTLDPIARLNTQVVELEERLLRSASEVAKNGFGHEYCSALQIEQMHRAVCGLPIDTKYFSSEFPQPGRDAQMGLAILAINRKHQQIITSSAFQAVPLGECRISTSIHELGTARTDRLVIMTEANSAYAASELTRLIDECITIAFQTYDRPVNSLSQFQELVLEGLSDTANLIEDSARDSAGVTLSVLYASLEEVFQLQVGGCHTTIQDPHGSKILPTTVLFLAPTQEQTGYYPPTITVGSLRRIKNDTTPLSTIQRVIHPEESHLPDGSFPEDLWRHERITDHQAIILMRHKAMADNELFKLTRLQQYCRDIFISIAPILSIINPSTINPAPRNPNRYDNPYVQLDQLLLASQIAGISRDFSLMESHDTQAHDLATKTRFKSIYSDAFYKHLESLYKFIINENEDKLDLSESELNNTLDYICNFIQIHHSAQPDPEKSLRVKTALSQLKTLQQSLAQIQADEERASSVEIEEIDV